MRFVNEFLSWNPRNSVVEVCSRLIRFPSENPPGDCREIAGFIASYLRDAGLSVRMIPGPSGQPNVVAELDFGPGPTLVLNGHMDVVPAGDPSRWSWDPFGGEVREGYVLGRGASDMKGGLAALMVALAYISSLPYGGLAGKIVFMAVPDEETGGHNGTEFLLQKGILGDACLIAEPSGSNPTIGQKGNIWLRLETEGKAAHGSLAPLVGPNAIVEMCRAITALLGLFEERWEIPPKEREIILRSQEVLRSQGRTSPAEALGRVTVNVGRISGGEKVNMIAAHCGAHLDLRVPIGLSTQKVLERVHARLRDVRAKAYRLEILSHNEPNYTAPEHPFVGTVLAAIRAVTRREVSPVLQWASSDARFFRYRGIPTVQYGPCALEGIHGYDERVPVAGLVQAARVYALIMWEFLRGNG